MGLNTPTIVVMVEIDKGSTPKVASCRAAVGRPKSAAIKLWPPREACREIN